MLTTLSTLALYTPYCVPQRCGKCRTCSDSASLTLLCDSDENSRCGRGASPLGLTNVTVSRRMSDWRVDAGELSALRRRRSSLPKTPVVTARYTPSSKPELRHPSEVCCGLWCVPTLTNVMPGEPETHSLLEQLATASLTGRDVERRALWLELREHCDASELPKPLTQDPTLLALAAASAELLAEQQGVPAPSWAAAVVRPNGQPIYLVHRHSAKGRQRLTEESPEPLRSRGFYASATYVSLV
jgi:hypothetical protein